MSFRRACAVFHRHVSLWKSPRPKGFRRRFALLFSICLLTPVALVSSALAQNTIHVPADQPTIQAGINAANNGDTVLVAPGTYYENIDFKGKAITVTSSAGASSTIISGSTKAATVVLASGETSKSVLSNFTISGGGGDIRTSGGIFISNSSPDILNNIITRTNCYGINSQASAPLIQGNEISFVSGQCGGFGAGSGIFLYLAGSYVVPTVIRGNTIEFNTESGLVDAGGNGGAGISIDNTLVVLDGNVIRYNATGKYFSPAGGGEGGGIFFNGGGLVVNNLIYGNTSNLQGGGISYYGFGSHPLALLNNTIADNAVVPVSTFSQQVLGGEQLYFDNADGLSITFANKHCLRVDCDSWDGLQKQPVCSFRVPEQ